MSLGDQVRMPHCGLEMLSVLEIAAFALPRWLIAAPLCQFLEGGRLHRTAALRALPQAGYL